MMIKNILSILSFFLLLSLSSCFGGKEERKNTANTTSSTEIASDDTSKGQDDQNLSSDLNPDGSFKDIVFKDNDTTDLAKLITAAKSLAYSAFFRVTPNGESSYEKFYGILSKEYTIRLLDVYFFAAHEDKDSIKLNAILAKPGFRKLRKVYSLLTNQEASIKFERQGQQSKFTLKIRVTEKNKDSFFSLREEFLSQ